jgi:alkanesulfonate monooxygenase SsuD/methylene tetrahydromethanopterin reductase-like flavin-dependent oxidoreductase (luciferase family)
VDQLSLGRLEVAVGAGGRFRPFAAFGIDGDRFVSRFTEGVRYMQAAWTQDRINFDGRFWQAKGLAMKPKPYQKPYPPLWFGGGHPDSLRRAVRLADGYIGAGSTPTVDFIEHARVLREELDRADRDPASFRVAKRVYLAVEDDPAVAHERLSAALDELYGFFGMTGVERVGVSGRPGEVVEELRSIVDAGAGMVLLNPLYDVAEQVERLAADVVPQLV